MTADRHDRGMLRDRDRHPELDEVAERLGASLSGAELVGWGDARSTHRLSLADGRSVAARRVTGNEPRARVEWIGRLMTALAHAGLPVPVPVIVETAAAPWLVTPWVDGATGASWLDLPDRARHLADRMGRLATRLRSVDLDSDGPKPRRSDTGSHGPGTLGHLAFVHGDFAPVNVVMHADGEIAALVDFEHAGTGPALLDVAWWGWVVRHHHVEAWTAAWPTFVAASGLEPGRVDATLHELVLQTLAERAAAADDAESSRRWLERLTAARSWTVPGCQAT